MRNLLFVAILVNILIISLGQRSPDGQILCPEALQRFVNALRRNSVRYLKSYADANPGETGCVTAYATYSILLAIGYFAEGETKNQIFTELDVKSKDEIVCIADVTNYPLYFLPDCIKLGLAIGVFGNDDYQFTPEFIRILTEVVYPKALAYNYNFSNANRAADTINTLVAKLTNNNIPNIIEDSSIFNSSTQLFTLNGWAFETEWEIEFQSKEIEFKISPTESALQEFLCQDAVYLYGRSEILDAEVVQVNCCCGSNFYIWSIVPNCLFTEGDLIEKMTQNDDWYYELKQVMKPTRLDLCIVKYKKKTKADSKALLLNTTNITSIYNSDTINLKGAIECDTPAAISAGIQATYLSASPKGGPVPKGPLSNGPKKTLRTNSPHVFLVFRDEEVYFSGIIRGPIN